MLLSNVRVYHLENASGRERGRAHGEEFRGEIATLAVLRTYLTRTVGGFDSDSAVLECAEGHLSVLEGFDQDLYDELVGIAEGAGVTAAEIVVLNHYTDLRDLGRAATAEPDGCSMVCVDTPAGVVTGQTWDMHASAMPFVIMARLPAMGREPGAWLLSLSGCLGMAGANDAGVVVLINNLTSIDAQVGIVWSALVRRALKEKTARASASIIEGARVGSGHHYLVVDSEGAIGIETSGTRRKRVFTGKGPYVHANHCLDADIAACSRVPATSTTYDRMRWLEESVAARAIVDADDLWARLGSVDGYPRSVSTMMATAEKPHAPATCAALVVDVTAGHMRACAGLSHLARGSVFELGNDR